MTDITVEVLGGNVVESYSNRPRMRVTIIDWDNIKAGDCRGVKGAQDCVPFGRMSPETQQVFQNYHLNS